MDPAHTTAINIPTDMSNCAPAIVLSGNAFNWEIVNSELSASRGPTVTAKIIKKTPITAL